MHRRDFLRLSLLASGALLTRSSSAQDAPVRLSIGDTISTVPDRFTGLSYESRQLGDPDFFSAKNTELVKLFRLLGKGVLRIGGNTSEYCFFRADAKAPATPISADPDKGHTAPPLTTITPQAIRNLREFLDATDWNLIYGLNLGKGTPESESAHAKFVHETCGPRLLQFQIGNEPDLFPQNGLRPRGWSFDQFAAEWKQLHDATRKRVPQAQFAGPANAKIEWTRSFAQRFQADVNLLTQHYYALGPASDPTMNIDRLLRSSARLQTGTIDPLTAISREMKLPWRLAETNSCYGGGKPDVSDTFASALWGVDMMFQLAASGASGVNYHGGGNGWYTPIAGSGSSGFTARPLCYAMLMFEQAQPQQMLSVEMPSKDPLQKAYAMRSRDGSTRLALINKNASQSQDISLPSEFARGSALALGGPALDAKSGITLGGSEVKNAAWAPTWTTVQSSQITLKPASAVLITAKKG